MKTRRLLPIALLALLAGCHHPQNPPEKTATHQPTIEQARAALLKVVEDSGNRWMGEDLKTEKPVKEGDTYRIGRWTIQLQALHFDFLHTNRNVTPPVLFEVHGVFEWQHDHLTARVTSGAQT